MKMIVVIDSKGGISKNGEMPWGLSLKQDLKHFKEMSESHLNIVGRKTFEQIKDVLNGRRYAVLTNNKVSINDVINKLRVMPENELPLVIGGMKTYETYLESVAELHLTIINKDFDCDTKFDFVDGGSIIELNGYKFKLKNNLGNFIENDVAYSINEYKRV